MEIKKKYGEWVVIGKCVKTLHTSKNGNVTYKYTVKCRCKCGKIQHNQLRTLRANMSKMCKRCANLGKVRFFSHLLSKSKEFRAWDNMLSRCHNKNHTSYHNYGGRGISVCNRWRGSFENFLSDVGKAPTANHSLDRFPNQSGNYEPGNCRWATIHQQANNRRTNILVTINGETKTRGEWACIYKIKQKTVSSRINDSGWDIIKAITTPVIHQSERKQYKTFLSEKML